MSNLWGTIPLTADMSNVRGILRAGHAVDSGEVIADYAEDLSIAS